jgi:hypothetical protein
LSIHQKISTLSSNTWFTVETAFRLKLRQRYCLVACKKGVISSDELDGMQIAELTKRSACERRTVRMRWRERSLDRMA